MALNLKANPFFLSESDIDWVKETLYKMSIEEKIGQLFCPIGYSNEESYLRPIVENYKIGGMMFRSGQYDDIVQAHKRLQQYSEIPLLLAANLEFGGTGIVEEGTHFGRQMQVAATGDPQNAYQLGRISAIEGGAVGVNWAFAPVVDIDYNYYNPITNVRTYGSDPQTVLDFARQYCKGVQENGMAASIKHFPGDGTDDRDQHLLVGVNRFSVEEWDSTYGRIYKELIDEGVLTVMAGHIALPAYQEKLNPALKNCQKLPASLSPELITGLLRNQLGFNGLIVTDATPMVGFTSAMPREKAVPAAISAGCDMFLFNQSLEEDYHYMLRGFQEGILTEERLNEAVTRILATKAALGLPAKKKSGRLVEANVEQLRTPEFLQLAKENVTQAITLVKDTQNLLPISVTKHKRVLLQILGPYEESNQTVLDEIKKRLEEEGFQITVYQPETMETFMSGQMDTALTIQKKYDLVLYFANVENRSNATTARLNWHTFFGGGNNLPWFVNEVPTVFVSLANPYHLLDVPMVKTYINAYDNSVYTIESVIEKVMGRSPFKGQSPIDPFCGREELRY
ncbi:glycoside hydrolase family 3 protein [Streptococcus ovuberis]|uniref:beta-N-acetylhexosaminidase n=1 Tax=Streptococcus ovuberis TaxID=1936207 RepID=A0A7X6MYN7_9STRE|nr:glycoside hydrolase family 3 N-terminal domain-containing protein [Streptococcus ovuberis]NKZ19903.1 glycoside hydrolase family 3 protein [Streptococcus ovuberis]